MSTAPFASALSILAGLLLVFFGRRIFWFFVAVVGFVAGMRLAPLLAPGQPDWAILAWSFGLGVLGAVLAMLLQRVAVAIAGGSAGGMLAGRLALAMGWTDPTLVWTAFLLGVLLAAIIASVLFDWALVGLTSISGALLVCDSITLGRPVELAIGLALVVIGIVVQSQSIQAPPARRV